MELNNSKAKRITWWQRNQIKISPWIFLAPGLIFFFIYVIAPIFVSIGISFYQWDGLSPSIYVGLQNYIELLDDEYFYISLWNNLKWLIFFMLAVPIGLGLAIFLNQVVFGIRLVKSLFFFPFVYISSGYWSNIYLVLPTKLWSHCTLSKFHWVRGIFNSCK